MQWKVKIHVSPPGGMFEQVIWRIKVVRKCKVFIAFEKFPPRFKLRLLDWLADALQIALANSGYANHLSQAKNAPSAESNKGH